MAIAATTAIQKTVKKVLPGFGTPFLSEYAVSANSQPTTDNTVATVTTATLANTVNTGYIHVQIDGVDSAVKIVSITVNVSDGTNTITVDEIAPVAADDVAGQPIEFLTNFLTQAAVSSASARITPSGTKGGTIEYSATVEIAGHLLAG
jgi:hypothetical protein